MVAAPFIAIGLEKQTPRVQNVGRRWQFGLVIPRAFDAHGHLKIETGFGPLKLLRLSTLMLGEEFVPINVSGHYGIKWVSDEVDHDYKTALQQELDYFAPSDGYVFSGSGKIRTQIGILIWGENYIFVWKNPNYSIPETIDQYFLAENEGWRAAVVTLPTDQDEVVESWLKDQFGVTVSAAARQWGILYPPPLDRDSDGNIAVGSLSQLFLGFSDQGDDNRFEDPIVARIEKQEVSIAPVEYQKRVISIAIPPEVDNYPLNLTWGARSLQPILRERRRSSEQAVEITLRAASGVVKAALHQPAATAILNLVRIGDAELVSVRVPQSVIGTLNVREGTLDWTEIARFEVSGAPTLDPRQLAVLTTFLQKRAVDVRLSFGCFGEFAARAEIAVPTDRALSKRLRERLKWYLRLTSQGPARFRINSLSDAAIVEAVNAPNLNPATVARRNLLLDELRIAEGAGRER